MTEFNAIDLELFRNLFASIADEMGVTLMRSSFSPNIKERRDYSCALFDADGEMVAQAAHIPVHLGSAPLSVRAALEFDPELRSAVVVNDPYSGGTHLPDITVVSPVRVDDELLFIVANRAHHADVGGTTPGSMGLTKSIDDEGIRIPPTALSDQLVEQICEASRTPDERRGDFQAQLAANKRGVDRLVAEFGRYGERLTLAASALQDHAERFMRSVLSEIPDGTYAFTDALDSDGFDAREIAIRCVMTKSGDHVEVDLSESADEVPGPLNVPRAVTVSAVYYAFRCLAPVELPNNGGYMRPIEVKTRRGSLLDARPPRPVAAGNVETSQRIADSVFGALAQALPDRIPAASNGSMNNITIGTEGENAFAYYETIGGGHGAGPGWAGASGLHAHMTNTLNTPVEALEHAYPFRVVRYAIRTGSGGAGEYVGGDGTVREYELLEDAELTLMTERRDLQPWGLNGGRSGDAGVNRLVRDGRVDVLPAKVTLRAKAGDRIVVETPGGGGWGSPPDGS